MLKLNIARYRLLLLRGRASCGVVLECPENNVKGYLFFHPGSETSGGIIIGGLWVCLPQ